MTAPLLLDTCAAIWITQNKPMADCAVASLDEASDRGRPVFVSPITAWEVGQQMSVGRMTVAVPARKWFAALTAVRNVRVLDLSADLLLDATDLPDTPPRDPADRILIASARAHALRIVTRDRKILDYARQGHVMALEC